MVFFECKIGEKKYVLEKLTLGQARILKRDFGLEQLEDLNVTDPDTLTGLLVLCLQVENPATPLTTLIEQVESMEAYDVNLNATAEDTDAAPSPGADEAADEGDAPAKASGKPATRRKTSGTRA